MKGKRGRPAIPMSNISYNKAAPGALSGDNTAAPQLKARGGAAKKRLDKKSRAKK